MKDSEEKEFANFLKVVSGQKEIGLVIAQNGSQLGDFSEIMNSENFKRSDTVFDLFNSSKTYIPLNENSDKDVYDFLVQFSTGQVEIFDKTEMKPKTFTPDYKNSCIVFLILKEDLNKLQAKGWNILANCGPTYQSQI